MQADNETSKHQDQRSPVLGGRCATCFRVSLLQDIRLLCLHTKITGCRKQAPLQTHQFRVAHHIKDLLRCSHRFISKYTGAHLGQFSSHQSKVSLTTIFFRMIKWTIVLRDSWYIKRSEEKNSIWPESFWIQFWQEIYSGNPRKLMARVHSAKPI